MRSHEARFWPGRRKLLPDHPLPSAGWRESRRPSTTGSITATRVARRRLFLRRRTPIMQPPRLKAAGFSASPDHPDPSTLAAEAYSRIALSCARVLKAPTMYHPFTTRLDRFTVPGVAWRVPASEEPDGIASDPRQNVRIIATLRSWGRGKKSMIGFVKPRVFGLAL